MYLNRPLIFFAAAFYVLGCLVPEHNYPWLAFFNEAPVGVSLLLLCCALACREPVWRVSFGPSQVFLLMAVLPWIQWWLGLIPFFGDAYVVSVYLGGAWLAYVAGEVIQTSDHGNRGAWDVLATTLLVVSIFSSWIGLRQAFGLTDSAFEVFVPLGQRPVGNLAQSNQYSTVVLLGIVSGCYLFLSGRLRAVVFTFVFLLLALGVSAAQSRTAVVVLFLLVVWAAYGGIKQNGPVCRRYGYVAVLCLVLILCWFVWPHVMKAVLGGSEAREVRDGVRLILWQEFFVASTYKWLWGYGWNQGGAAQVSVANDFPPVIYVDSAHNIVLDLAVSCGWPIALGLVVAALVWLFRRLKRNVEIGSWYGIGLMLPIAVHSLFEYPYRYAYFLLVFFFAAGLIKNYYKNDNGFYVTRRAVALLVIFSGLVFYGLVSDYILAEGKIAYSRLKGAGSDAEDAVAFLPRYEGVKYLDQLVLLDKLSSLSYRGDAMGVSNEDLELGKYRFPYPVVMYHNALKDYATEREGAVYFDMCLIYKLYGSKEFYRAFRELNRKLGVAAEGSDISLVHLKCDK